jgi:hypothetical protein
MRGSGQVDQVAELVYKVRNNTVEKLMVG